MVEGRHEELVKVRPGLWDSPTSFQVGSGYGPVTTDATRLDPARRAHRQRDTRLPALRHLATDASKGVRRYQTDGTAGLAEVSRRPHSSPGQKVDDELEGLILRVRREHRLGARRLQGELLRQNEGKLSLATIHKVLTRNQVAPLKRHETRPKTSRYEPQVPGERVQLDTCKIAPGLYQYTAVDDCSGFRVLEVYPRRSAKYTVDFLEHLDDATPFPIQRIQTDRGGEFFAVSVQRASMQAGIKFRSIRPAAPHVKGKVERSERTDKDELWARLDVCSLTLDEVSGKAAAGRSFTTGTDHMLR